MDTFGRCVSRLDTLNLTWPSLRDRPRHRQGFYNVRKTEMYCSDLIINDSNIFAVNFSNELNITFFRQIWHS